jgi:hypothetical protein
MSVFPPYPPSSSLSLALLSLPPVELDETEQQNSHGYYSVTLDAGSKTYLQGHLDPGYINMPLYTTSDLVQGKHTITLTNEWDYNGTPGGPFGKFTFNLPDIEEKKGFVLSGVGDLSG